MRHKWLALALMAATLAACGEAPEQTSSDEGAASAVTVRAAPEVGPDGLYVEPWFRPASGDLSRDHGLAAGEGKLFAVFWEREGCEYCAAMHTEALTDPAFVPFLTETVYPVVIDFRGRAPLVDLDGKATTGRDLARRLGVQGTPTIQVWDQEGTLVLSLSGYPGPAILLSAFEFLEAGAFRETGIAPWLRERGLL